MFNWKERTCRKYQIRMESSVGAGRQVPESDQDLNAHLQACQRCREALAAAELTGKLFSAAELPEPQPTEAFVSRVMASIREEEAILSVPGQVWRPLEALASRFALVSAVVLLALSVFLGEFSPALRQPEVVSTGPAVAQVKGDWPEPPAQPATATQDEVLMSLVDVDNGF